jgi:protein-disulfide isomerase
LRQTRTTVVIAVALLALHGLSRADPAPAPAESTGFTADGHPALGLATAPVIVEEWSDYLCPFCARHFSVTVPQLVDSYVRDGRVRLVFRNFPIEALHPGAPRGHVAAICAGEQGAAQYWRMHDALFSRQKDWNRLPDPAAFLDGVARELGLDMARFASCLASDRPRDRIGADRGAGEKLGFNGTPSFRLATADGKLETKLEGAEPFERFAEAIDALLAGKLPAAPPPPPRPELPAWARPEAWRPDPARPGFNVGGDAYKGNVDAKLTVIVFSDYQCAGCAKHELQVQPALDAEFVDTGRVLWITKALPLKEHAQAALAAAAAECAGEQSRFWPMHRALFESTAAWSGPNPDEALQKVAAQAGVDPARFRGCLESRPPWERILRDLYDAQDIVRTTPSFVLVRNGEGSLMGPLPADQFAKVLRRELENAVKPAAPGPTTP